jgi:TatD DNase family protein
MELMEFVDTHTHLFSEEFMEDQQGVINRALKARVKTLLLPNIDIGSISALKEFSELAPENCFPMMGLHPCSVGGDFLVDLAVIKEELYSSYRYYGVGEIGLDYHWDKTYIEQQKQAFISQCEWAVELGLPISIHTRSATYDVIKCLKSMKKMPDGVFHCFSGSREEADEIIKLGFYLGIGGVVTFKNSGLNDILKNIPLERIVMETDSPYLSPVPFRGKRNESAYIPYIAEKLSEIYGTSVSNVAGITTANARNVFSL